MLEDQTRQLPTSKDDYTLEGKHVAYFVALCTENYTEAELHTTTVDTLGRWTFTGDVRART